MTFLGGIASIGISVHDHEAAEVGRFTLDRADRVRRLPELAAALDASELVYLATCNRVELLFRRRPSAEIAEADRDRRSAVFACLRGREPLPGEAERALRSLKGEPAVAHLFEVAAGLDSAQLGERDIQGQLRDALALARQAGTSGARLDQLVEEALRTARAIHLRTQLGAGRVSLAEIAAEPLLERLRRTPSIPAEAALVGVSPMTRRVAEILHREGVRFVVVNRTLEHAAALVAELGAGRAQALDAFRLSPPRVEAVLCATGSPEPVLDRAALERLAAHTASQEPPLVVDLAVPPDVDPAVARAVCVPRIGMDEIVGMAEAQRQSRQGEAAAARRLVEEALVGLNRRLAERALSPVIARINRRFRKTALDGVDRLLARQGRVLDEAEREAVERWAETLARRFAHLPTLGLRALAAEHGMAAVRSFLAACDAPAAAELGDDDAAHDLLSQVLEEELLR